MFLQRLFPIEAGGIEKSADLVQRHTELPVKKDLLQPIHLLRTIEAISVRSGASRPQ